MVILDFIRKGSLVEFRRLLLYAVVAGLANALVMMVVNQIAGFVAQGGLPNLWHALVFAGVFLLYYQFDRLAVLRANVLIERLLKRLRIDVMDALRRSELPVIEKLGRGNLYAAIGQGTNLLSVTFPLMVEHFQLAILLAASLAYLAYLSLAAFLIFLAGALVGYIAYQRLKLEFGRVLQTIAQQEGQMLDAVGDIIDGAKELRLSDRRSEAVLRSYRTLAGATEALLVRSGELSVAMILVSGLIVYGMLAAVGFIFPQYGVFQGPVVFKLIPTLLFCVGPLIKIVSYGPTFVQAEVALKSILAIEHQLKASGSISPSEARALGIKYRDFNRINYAHMSFSFRDAQGEPVFTVGPVDLEVRRGETVFLVGGNGSGKSTIMRLVSGLYPAEEGRIEVDGRPVTGREIAGLRELFSVILGDFHLFDRLYGLENADPAEVTRLIGEMRLGRKVRFENGRFSDLQLSTGERKRLALIAAILEDRPVYVFDEWSAEQDVHFREEFYTKIIPGLRANGKTVLAVTHDDRYWHLADRVIKLDLGTVVWERAGTELTDGSV
ncbi:MAG TPA: cyclic peptide export ABC transporter [Reyranella sp.]|nr:cyclic peptide export ABC transporter [Reyranella sp.]